MPLIKSTFSTVDAPLEVRASAQSVSEYLLRVDEAGKVYPLTDSIERLSPDTFRWRMKDRRVGTIHFSAVQVGRFVKDGYNVVWEAVEGQGGNLKNWGRWIISPKGEQACALSVETFIEVDLPLPGPLATFARQLAEAEMAANWKQYIVSLKRVLEGGSATVPDAVAAVAKPTSPNEHSKKFEDTRLSERAREANYKTQVSEYYDHVTELYRSGWGDHFHFAAFRPKESVESAILRLEESVARSAGIGRNSYVLDVGCGVGGPTTHIAKLTGCRIRGLNITQSQVLLARKRAAELGLAGRAEFDHGDAMSMPYKDATFDSVTFFESICHMPDKDGFWKEVNRVLKPGGFVAGSDWLKSENVTPYEQVHFIEPICEAHSVPHLGSLSSYASGMEKAGMVVHAAIDLRKEGDIMPNWDMLDGKTIEAFRSLPKGQMDKTHEMMMIGAIALTEGARCGAFLLGRFLAQKPKSSPSNKTAAKAKL